MYCKKIAFLHILNPASRKLIINSNSAGRFFVRTIKLHTAANIYTNLRSTPSSVKIDALGPTLILYPFDRYCNYATIGTIRTTSDHYAGRCVSLCWTSGVRVRAKCLRHHRNVWILYWYVFWTGNSHKWIITCLVQIKPHHLWRRCFTPEVHCGTGPLRGCRVEEKSRCTDFWYLSTLRIIKLRVLVRINKCFVITASRASDGERCPSVIGRLVE
jgi:hypothetical protein